ncbi:MAG: signal recognition particle protein [Deltaproteobacteria bacterium]|nr:signal recognition particle protein [Deltaproteobacteria bacterium]
MFDTLSEKLQRTFKNIRGQGKLTERNMGEGLRQIRMALLEADVNFRVVKEFVANVESAVRGQHVLDSVSPTQQLIKIVHDELVRVMGGAGSVGLDLRGDGISTIMMVGLQGSGKTTTAGKLARQLKKDGHRPMLVAADVQRPAAIDQLEVVAGQVDVPCFARRGGKSDPVLISRDAIKQAKRDLLDVVLIDTAGRLHVDSDLMAELRRIKGKVHPTDILLVVDAMTGQDAVNVAKQFNADLSITGSILTKLDGDARGGAALSVRHVAGCPIKFVGVGEKLDALESFHPERMASRILGMGDVVTLVEKAQETIDDKEAARLEEKLLKQQFTFEDFRDSLRQLKKMGPLDQVLKMMPGIGDVKGMQVDDRDLARVEAIINSMTAQERSHPHVIKGSRRRRIASGSGTTVQDVNRLLKQFEQMKKMMKVIGRKGKMKRMLAAGQFM